MHHALFKYRIVDSLLRDRQLRCRDAMKSYVNSTLLWFTWHNASAGIMPWLELKMVLECYSVDLYRSTCMSLLVPLHFSAISAGEDDDDTDDSDSRSGTIIRKDRKMC